jgi:hypothetical protein
MLCAISEPFGAEDPGVALVFGLLYIFDTNSRCSLVTNMFVTRRFPFWALTRAKNVAGSPSLSIVTSY